jgi:hypothetical protein
MKPIIFNGETFYPICPFADGWYYESGKHYLLTGPKGDIEFHDVRRENVPEIGWRS